MRAMARVKLTIFNQLTYNFLKLESDIIIKKDGVFVKKKILENVWKKFWKKIFRNKNIDKKNV